MTALTSLFSSASTIFRKPRHAPTLFSRGCSDCLKAHARDSSVSGTRDRSRCVFVHGTSAASLLYCGGHRPLAAGRLSGRGSGRVSGRGSPCQCPSRLPSTQARPYRWACRWGDPFSFSCRVPPFPPFSFSQLSVCSTLPLPRPSPVPLFPLTHSPSAPLFACLVNPLPHPLRNRLFLGLPLCVPRSSSASSFAPPLSPSSPRLRPHAPSPSGPSTMLFATCTPPRREMRLPRPRRRQTRGEAAPSGHGSGSGMRCGVPARALAAALSLVPALPSPPPPNTRARPPARCASTAPPCLWRRNEWVPAAAVVAGRGGGSAR